MTGGSRRTSVTAVYYMSNNEKIWRPAVIPGIGTPHNTRNWRGKRGVVRKRTPRHQRRGKEL